MAFRTMVAHADAYRRDSRTRVRTDPFGSSLGPPSQHRIGDERAWRTTQSPERQALPAITRLKYYPCGGFTYLGRTPRLPYLVHVLKIASHASGMAKAKPKRTCRVVRETNGKPKKSIRQHW